MSQDSHFIFSIMCLKANRKLIYIYLIHLSVSHSFRLINAYGKYMKMSNTILLCLPGPILLLSNRYNIYTILVHCRSIWVICLRGLETREKARLRRAFSRVSRRIHIFTYMLRQCTCIVFILQF